MTRRKTEHQSLSEVLKEFVTENNLEKGLDKVAARDVWEQVMGPAIQKYTHTIRLDRETLYVQLTSSVLREELSYGKDKIVTMLNEKLGKSVIKSIKLL